MLRKRILTVGLIGVLTLGMSAGTVLAEDTEDAARDAAELVEMLNADEDGVAGIYRLIGLYSEEEEIGEEEIEMMEAMGYSARLTLLEDGTGDMDLFGEEMDVEWDETSISVDGDSVEYTLEDGVLQMGSEDDEDGYLLFQKMTADELENGVSSEPLQPGDYDPDTRAGYYTLSTMEEDGEVTDAAVLSLVGMEIYLVLNEDGTGRMDMLGIPVELTWDDDALTIEGEASEYSYDAGSITIEDEGTVMTFVYVGTPDEAPEADEEAAE